MANQSQLTAFLTVITNKWPEISMDKLENMLNEIIGPKSIEDCTNISQLMKW